MSTATLKAKAAPVARRKAQPAQDAQAGVPAETGDFTIDARTLSCIEKSIANLKLGKRSQPADLAKYAKFAK